MFIFRIKLHIDYSVTETNIILPPSVLMEHEIEEPPLCYGLKWIKYSVILAMQHPGKEKQQRIDNKSCYLNDEIE